MHEDIYALDVECDAMDAEIRWLEAENAEMYGRIRELGIEI